MPQAPAQPQTSFTDSLRGGLNFLSLAAHTLATFGEVTFFRTGFGARYFQGWSTGLVIPLMVVFPVFWPNHDPRGVYFCLLLYLVRCVWHRAGIIRRNWRHRKGMVSAKQVIYSRYNGQSVLTKRFPRLSEIAIKRFAEPLVMGGMGLCALTFSPPLGWFFLWCAVGMFVHTHLLFAHDHHRVLDTVDAALESETLAECFREARGGGDVVRIHRSQR